MVNRLALRQKKVLLILIISLLSFVLLCYELVQTYAQDVEKNYVGAGKCMTCHQKEYSEWKSSGHSEILQKPSDRNIMAIPLPEGYSLKDISYIIGGYKWKALFLDSEGYIVTSNPAGNGKNQYNVKSRQWVDYLPGERVHYDCGRCHTTGFSSEGHHYGYKGIIGKWKFEGVQCEACHGPGSRHSRSSLKTDIIKDTKICMQCHGLEPLHEIPLTGVFLSGYTETNQLLKNKMKNLSCTDCHNPHLPSGKSIKQSCEDCHQDVTVKFNESYMFKLGIKCIDCHMAPAGLIAEGTPEKFQGDFRSHLFRIDHSKAFPVMEEKNGKRMNLGYLSVDYACMYCHYIEHERQWAVRFAMFAHTVKVTTNIKIMQLQTLSTYLAFFCAVMALITGLYLKNYLFRSVKLSKKKILTYHRLFSWIAFSIFAFNAILCIYIHFPLEQPSKVLKYGWFVMHPVNALLGAILYTGKIFVVRKFKKGWTSQGLLWGIGIFLFWLIHLITVIAN